MLPVNLAQTGNCYDLNTTILTKELANLNEKLCRERETGLQLSGAMPDTISLRRFRGNTSCGVTIFSYFVVGMGDEKLASWYLYCYKVAPRAFRRQCLHKIVRRHCKQGICHDVIETAGQKKEYCGRIGMALQLMG